MAKKTTTIYIDDSAIRVLVAGKGVPLKWTSMPLEPGLVKYGVVHDEDDVAARLKKLWKDNKIGKKRVIVGISGINCLYRLITLPELPKDMLPEAVRREAARILASPLEQLYLSWQTLPSPRGETLIYLAASPRNSVDALISTMHKAKLKPYLMDLKPMALARTVTEPRAIIVDVQPASFDIVIMVERIPQVVRSLALTQEALPEEKISLIQEELDRAITFYDSSHTDKPIESTTPLLVSGELAEQQNIQELLLEKLQRPIQAFPSPFKTPKRFPSNQYATNIGLALKEVLPSEKGSINYSLVNFNALPEAYIPKPRPVSELLFIPTIVAGIALVALGGLFNYTALNDTANLQSERANINQMVASKQAEAKDIIALSEQVSSLETTADAFTTTLSNFAAGRGEINGDLAEINRLPEGLDFHGVTAGGDTLTVSGSADDEYTIFNYAQDLRASGRFALVVITNMQPKEQQIGFTLILVK